MSKQTTIPLARKRIHTKASYQRPEVDYKRQRKSYAQPDQSMSIEEIVKKFVKGLPVNVLQRTPVYVDQTEHDLEKLNRMDFGEKAAMAADLKAQAEQTAAELNKQARERSEQAKQQKAKQQQAERGANGIDPLDNTMPVDTKLTARQLASQQNQIRNNNQNT